MQDCILIWLRSRSLQERKPAQMYNGATCRAGVAQKVHALLLGFKLNQLAS